MDNLPYFSADLIEQLDQLYPPLDADDIMSLTKKELAFRAGRRAVVEHLLMVRQRSEEDQLNVHSEEA